MKVTTQITIYDDNNNIVVQDSFEEPHVQGESQYLVYEVVHSTTGNPLPRKTSKFPKF